MLRQLSKVVLLSNRSLRVLLTNHYLGDPGGTEVNIRDWAIGLLRRGHRPVAYAPVLGRTADLLRTRAFSGDLFAESEYILFVR